MEYSWFIDLISTVGLPIALVIAMGLFIYKIYKQSVAREDELRAEIKSNQATNAEAIKTLALYAERLGVMESDIKEIKEDVMIINEHITKTN